MKIVRLVCLVLMVIGALNWGLVGLFKYNLVTDIFGAKSTMARFIFSLVGLAGLYGVAMLCGCRKCNCGCGSNCKCHKQ